MNESREKDLFKIRPEELGVLDQLLDDVRNLKSRSNIVKLCEMTVRMRRHAPFNVMLIYRGAERGTHAKATRAIAKRHRGQRAYSSKSEDR